MDSSELNELLDQVPKGQNDAFQHIVRAHGYSVRCYLASLVYHMDDADDLAQEVFITAFKRLHTFRRENDFGAWLRGIARNLVRMHFRTTGRRTRAIDRFREEVADITGHELDAAASVSHNESIGALLRCVSRLPDRLRRAVQGGLEGVAPSEIATNLKTSVAAVYQMHWRAHQLLRDCLARELSR